MEPEEKKVNWKRLLITIGIVLVTSGIIGGALWYMMDQQAKEDKDAHDKQIQELQNQIDELNTKGESSEEEKIISENVYTNDKGKFSIELSENYAFSEGFYSCEGRCAQTIDILKKKKDSTYEDLLVDVGFGMYPQETTIDEYIKDVQGYENATTIEDTKIAGVNAKHFTAPGFGGTSKNYHFINNGIAYSIRVSDLSTDNQDATSALEEILASFKFTN